MTADLAVTDEQAAVVDRLARFIIRFGLTVPAIISLESVRPLSFVGSQFMHVLTPSITAILTGTDWDALARLLERRGGIDYCIERIEALSQEAP